MYTLPLLPEIIQYIVSDYLPYNELVLLSKHVAHVILNRYRYRTSEVSYEYHHICIPIPTEHCDLSDIGQPIRTELNCTREVHTLVDNQMCNTYCYDGEVCIYELHHSTYANMLAYITHGRKCTLRIWHLPNSRHIQTITY